MNQNHNFRVFRRNGKNLILLWSSKAMTGDQQENLRVYAVDTAGGIVREITWKPFVADNPDKFAPDVAGVVLGHSSNGLDPALPCSIKVVFGTGDDTFELEKDVLPANAPVEQQQQSQSPRAPAPGLVGLAMHCHLHAYNYDTKEWVPLPWTSSLQDKTILIKEERR